MTDPLLHDLAVLHAQGKLDETALRYVVGERIGGTELGLDHLVMIFGVADIHRILTAAKAHPADRVLLRSRFEDIVETLRAVNTWGATSPSAIAIAGVVAANLKLLKLLADVLCPPLLAEPDPVAALDAAFPIVPDSTRDAP